MADFDVLSQHLHDRIMNCRIGCHWLPEPRFRTLYLRATEHVAGERRRGLLQDRNGGRRVAFCAVRASSVRYRAAF